ncbi:MAG: hypothetical protein CMN06_08990 [Roseibacillus sp.]|nr:hypothetical protein [Roseibacillus sp.]
MSREKAWEKFRISGVLTYPEVVSTPVPAGSKGGAACRTAAASAMGKHEFQKILMGYLNAAL